ncbi:MAG: AAA family ATPase [Cyanobacteriota bacterium]
MLTQLQLRNFKSYRSATLPLGCLTLLIGANASGKSNVIEALRLLAKMAEGERLSFLGASHQPNESIFRGDVENLGYRGSKTFGFSCLATAPQFQEIITDKNGLSIDDWLEIAAWSTFTIDLTLEDDGALRVTDEKMTSDSSTVPLYEIASEPQGAGSDVFVTYNNFARGGKKPSIVCSSQMAIFTQLLSDIRFRPENVKSQKIIPKVVKRYIQWLSSIVFLNPEPSLMRYYGHKTDKFIKESGENLSGVIYNLCLDPEMKALILGFIQSLPEQNIEDISFIETPRNEVMLQLTETFGGVSTPYDASMLSDGTLRALAIVAALLSAPEQSLVVIEEIDNGIHPSRAEDLLKRVANIAKNRHLRVLMSSHNPALLDGLPEEAIPETVFCYRSLQDGSSQLVRLKDIADYPELVAQGSLGFLMTCGLLDRFVKHHPGAEAKKKKAMDWLNSLVALGE